MRSDELWEDEATVGDASRRPDRRPQARDGDAPAWSGRVVPLRRDAPPLLKPASGLDIADIAALLLRELGLMLIIFCVIFGLGAVAALRMPKAYTASASLLMQLGKDYVYNPLAGDAARGAIATIDQVVQSEVEILNSTELKKRVIRRLGYRTILPSAPNMWNPRTDVQRAAADTAAVRVLQSGLGTATAPQDNVVRLSFKFSNAQGAALILNTLIDEYQTYRQNVFTDAMGPMLRQQKDSFDRQLAVADAAYQSFLEQNGVGDFTAAKATYSKVYDSVQTDLYTARALLAQDRARLAEVEANLKGVSPEMSVERNLDLTIPTRILTLQQQRQEMLSRYLPQAQPIKDLDAQIASLQAMVNSGQGVGEKDHKMGVNTVYQGLMTQKLDLSADIAAQEGRIAQLEAQSAQVTKKTQDLLGLEAQFNTLSAERDSLQTNIKDFTRRIEENDAQRHMAHGADDAVRVVEKAVPPDRPKSLKSIVLILSFLFASVTALSAGVARIYTRKGFASAGMASRALDLPVLAQAQDKDKARDEKGGKSRPGPNGARVA